MGSRGFDAGLLAFGAAESWTLTFFVFQLMFCGTAATILSGAVAERMSLAGYTACVLSLAVLIYPVAGHWAWGGLLTGDDAPFLAAMGFIDFAGSTVVHSVGAWVALAAVIVIGPRAGKFDEAGRPRRLRGHSPVLSTAGVVILWFGWIGFNGGSTTAGTSAFAHVVANTMIAGAAGGVVQMMIGRAASDHFRPEFAINGILAGLVGITAGCDAVDPRAAFLIGGSAGAVAYAAARLIEEGFGLDDPLEAISVHGFAGVWGTVMTGVLARPEHLLAGSRLEQVGVQLLGAAIVFAWAFGAAYVLLHVYGLVVGGGPRGGLRVSEEAERMGLNAAEHDAPLGTGILQEAMAKVAFGGGTTTRLEVDPGDESHEMAELFNRIMDNIEGEQARQAAERPAMEAEVGLVIEACRAGDYSRRLGEAGKEGFFLELSRGVNAICAATSTSLASARTTLNAVAGGDLSARVEGQFEGAFAEIQGALNGTLDDLDRLLTEVEATVAAAGRGNFDCQLDPAGREGFMERLCEGVNDLAAGCRTVLSETTDALRLLARGDLSASIDGPQEGLFADIQEALEDTVGGLGRMIAQIEGVVLAAGEGDFAGRIDAGGAEGFLARLTDGVNRICETSEEGLDQIHAALAALASGDLTATMQGRHAGMFAEIKVASDATADQLRGLISEIAGSTERVGRTVAGIAERGEALREQSRAQVEGVDRARALIGALRAQSEGQMERTFEARAGCDTARGRAEHGKRVAGDAVAHMEAVREATVDITRTVELIEELAFQTNIIALNAGIEAERYTVATGSTNGFSVLAREVRALANHSAEAATKIRERSQVAQGAVASGAELVGAAETTLDEILAAVRVSDDLVRQAADASSSQIKTLGEVDDAVVDIEARAGQNLEMVSDTSAASHDLLDRAEHAARLIDRFDLGVHDDRAAA